MNLVFEALNNWLNQTISPNTPDLASRIAGAIFAARNGRLPTENDLDGVAALSMDSRSTRYEGATTLLGLLAEIDERALLVIENMSKAPRSSVRHNSLLALTPTLPRHFTVEIVGRLLRDRSARVRRKASDKIGSFQLTELADQLSRALTAEQDMETAELMSEELALMTVGFVIRPGENGAAITVKGKGGCTYHFVSESELASRSISDIVRELRGD